MKICSRKRGGKLRDEREEEKQRKGTSTVVIIVPRFNLEKAFCEILCSVY